jgi:hypothetical protein
MTIDEYVAARAKGEQYDAELREALKARDRDRSVAVEYADFLDQVLGEWGDDPEGERMRRYAADLRVLALIAPEDDQ